MTFSEIIATIIGWTAALFVCGVLLAVLLLSGCTSSGSIQAVSDVCTMGDVQAYQRVSPQEKVQFVCK